jgi:hypothetical protein
VIRETGLQLEELEQDGKINKFTASFSSSWAARKSLTSTLEIYQHL